MKKKTVKAWAVVDTKYGELAWSLSRPEIYSRRMIAKKNSRFSEVSNFVPCTITYTLPASKKRKV